MCLRQAFLWQDARVPIRATWYFPQATSADHTGVALQLGQVELSRATPARGRKSSVPQPPEKRQKEREGNPVSVATLRSKLLGSNWVCIHNQAHFIE